MRVLITGITGWTGSYLARYIIKHQPETQVIGLAWGAEQADLPATIAVYQVDLTDAEATVAALAELKPEQIYHLAAAVGPIWAVNPQRAMSVNVMGTANLLMAAGRLSCPPKILVVSSSAVYGRAGEGLIPETAPLQPLSLYGISKAAQDMLAYQAYTVYGLPTIRMRTFNQTGPGEPPHLVGGAIAQQIAQIEAGLVKPVVQVGNLTPVRDFVDIRDVIRGYVLAMQRGRPGLAYNLCRGQGCSIQQMLDLLTSLSRVPLRVEQREERQRKAEIPRQVGNPACLHQDTGWQAEIPLERSMADLLQSWRERISGGIPCLP